MIQLTREIRFSINRPDRAEQDSRDRVVNGWAGWPAARGIAPYLLARVTLRGVRDPRTGYLCNIVDVDRVFRDACIPVVAREVRADSSTEAIVLALWNTLTRAIRDMDASPTLELDRLELSCTPTLRVAKTREDRQMLTLTQSFEFSAAHRLHCADLSDDENRRIFGKCNNPRGHGHNYVVDVTVRGEPNARTGMIMDIGALERIVAERVIDVLDHKHLNDEVAQFKTTNPSVENIATLVFDMLNGALAPAELANVRVYETPKTWADVAAS